jgi:hypothetical protein
MFYTSIVCNVHSNHCVGKTYWFNSRTGESTYVNPNKKKVAWSNDVYEETYDGHGLKYYYNTTNGETVRALPSKTIANVITEDEGPVQGENDWEQVTDNDGQVYYYSPSRNETSWVIPEKVEVEKSLWEDEEYANHFQAEIEKSGKWVYAPLEEPTVPGKRVYLYTASNGQVVKVEF